MKTKLIQSLLLLLACASLTQAQAEQSLIDRVNQKLNENRFSVRTPTAVAGVRG